MNDVSSIVFRNIDLALFTKIDILTTDTILINLLQESNWSSRQVHTLTQEQLNECFKN